MGSSIYWRPKKQRYLQNQSLELKQVILDNDWDSFGEEEIDYLMGLRDAGIEGAEELIEIIEKVGRISIEVSA